MNTSVNSQKGFQFGIIAIVCFLVFLLLKGMTGAEYISIDTYTYVGGFMMILVVVASLIGFFYAMKSLKEPNSMKKTLALIINTILLVLFVVTTIVNIIDFNNSF